MSCPACGSPAVAFRVPPTLREYAPAERSAICSRCLETFPASDVDENLRFSSANQNATRSGDVDESRRLSSANQTQSDDAEAAAPEDADFAAVHESFPSGRAGVAFALALGKLDSLALHRSAIEALCEAAEREGTDVRLALERLATAENLDPQFDVERRTQQLDSFR